MKKFLKLIKQTFAEWSEDKAARLAAALAYYAAFSLGPILVIVLAVVGLFWNQASAQEQVVQQVTDLAGEQAGGMVSSMLESARDFGANTLATIVGVVALIFGAIGVFGQLEDALNTIWDVEEKPGGGLWGMIKERLFSFTLVIGIGVMLLISLVVSAGLTAFEEWTTGLFPGYEYVLQLINFAVSFLIITLMFALLFKYVPNVRIAWKDVWLGAAVTALLFTIGKFAIGLYLGSGSAVGQFGPAGSLVIILLWVYYSAQIIFLGAEFTQVYANMYGSRIQTEGDETGSEASGRAAAAEKRAAPSLNLARHTQPDAGTIPVTAAPDHQLPPVRQRPLLPVFSLVSLAAGVLTGFLLSLAGRVRR